MKTLKNDLYYVKFLAIFSIIHSLATWVGPSYTGAKMGCKSPNIFLAIRIVAMNTTKLESEGGTLEGKYLEKEISIIQGTKQYKSQPKHESHVRTQTSVPTEN